MTVNEIDHMTTTVAGQPLRPLGLTTDQCWPDGPPADDLAQAKRDALARLLRSLP